MLISILAFFGIFIIPACVYFMWCHELKQIGKLIVENQKLWNKIKKDLKDEEKDEAYLSFIESLPNTPHGKGYPLE